MRDYKMKPHGKLQDTKSTRINKLHFCTLTEQSQMELKKTIPSKRRAKIILKNKPNKEGERFIH